mmetsp:Transcript_3127/g.10315  ORF Transcript_3127/g.10315 Transcript_3127/m.10315 type:complete len:190 (+) Transcript_3127:73-642(+)
MLSSRSLNGLRALLVATPVASAVAVAVLLLRVRSHGSVHAELFALSLLEVGAPVVPLALLPRASRRAGGGWVHSDRLGTAYGTIETLFILMQITITMLLGVLRSVDSDGDGIPDAEDPDGKWRFVGPLSLLAGGFAGAAVVSVLLLERVGGGAVVRGSDADRGCQPCLAMIGRTPSCGETESGAARARI